MRRPFRLLILFLLAAPQLTFALRHVPQKQTEGERPGRAALSVNACVGVARQEKERSSLICIDPGHSRQTVGATANHLQEYKVCWQMAEKLKEALQSNGDRVLLTKSSQDENVPNAERARISNRNKADLLIRLHCDAGPESGIATFFPADQGEIRGVRGPSREVLAQSRRCAYAFHTALIKALAAQGAALHNRGVRTDAQTYVGGKLGGALEGSIYSRRPVILVEMCVLDSKADARFIRSAANQTLLAKAMATGVQAAVRTNRR